MFSPEEEYFTENLDDYLQLHDPYPPVSVSSGHHQSGHGGIHHIPVSSGHHQSYHQHPAVSAPVSSSHHYYPPSTSAANLIPGSASVSASVSAAIATSVATNNAQLMRHSSPALSHHSSPSMSAMGLKDHRHSTPNRVSIREANDHLQLLHQRVSDLEDIIRSQGIALSEKDAHYRRQIKEMKESKDRHIDDLSRAIIKIEEKNQDLEVQTRTANAKFEEAHEKLMQLDRFLSQSLPTFEHFLSELKQYSLKTSELNQVLSQGHQLTSASKHSSQQNTPEKKPSSRALSTASTLIGSGVQNKLSNHHNSGSQVVATCASSSSNGSTVTSSINNANNVAVNDSPKHQLVLNNNQINGNQSHSIQNGNSASQQLKQQHLAAIAASIASDVINSDSGHVTSSNASDSSRTNPKSYNLVLHELKGHYEKALQREQKLEERERDVVLLGDRDTVSEPIPPKPHRDRARRAAEHQSSNSRSTTSSRARKDRDKITQMAINICRAAQLQANGSPTASGASTPPSASEPKPAPQPRRSLPAVTSSSNSNHTQPQQQQHISMKVGRSFAITSNFSDQEVDAYGDDDAPPPPAPPASKTSNTNLPSLQAPRRYYQSSY